MKQLTLKAAFLVLAVLASVTAEAGEITEHGVYVYLDTHAREVTLEGMERRLEALSRGATRTELRRLGLETQERVRQVFAGWAVTPLQHATYGGRHAEEIEAWIERHPSWARTYSDLDTRFESLSSKLNAARR